MTPWRTLSSVLHPTHPAHPDDAHRFRILEIDDGATLVSFAVSEFSNEVRGFCGRRQERVETATFSAGGLLRYHRSRARTEAREDEPACWAVRRDAATGEVLVDGSALAEGRVSGNADGGRFRQSRNEAGESLVRIDPIHRTCRRRGEVGGLHPRQTLPDAHGQALHDSARRGPMLLRSIPSPPSTVSRPKAAIDPVSDVDKRRSPR